MGQDMKGSGMKPLISEMGKDTRSGLMDLFMRDTGRMTRRTVEED